MYDRIVFVTLLVLIVLQNVVDGRKQRKTKQPTETESPFPQPSVLTYSTFGFNDVRSHDGFVPTSPDYSNYRNKYKESSEKLYAPAFPSAPDSDFTSNAQMLNGESFASPEGQQQSSMLQFDPSSSYRSSNFKSDDNMNRNSDVDYRQSSENNDRPVYGTKIIYNNKNTSFNGYNNSELINSESYNDHKYLNFDESHYFNDNKPLHSGSINNNRNLYEFTTFPTQEIENSMKAAPVNSQGSLNFPKVLDFIHSKPYDTLENENKHSKVISQPFDTINSLVNIGKDESLKSYEDKATKQILPGFKNVLENNGDTMSKEVQNSYEGFSNKYSKYNAKSKKLNYDYKDLGKNKLRVSGDNDKKQLNNILKGYKYTTNFSTTSFKFDDNEPRKQYNSNNDELISSSSNDVHYSNYQFPQKDYSNLKPTPSSKYLYTDIRDAIPQNNGHKNNPSEDYLNKFKNLYGTVPTSSTNWGSIFKNTDPSIKTHNTKPTYEVEENYDYVHIPKRPSGYRYEKDSDGVAPDWSVYTKTPNTYNIPKNEWNKEKYNNRFKSEEDLLGLRNHDTSHPAYLPTFQYHGNDDSEESFKTAVGKWREDYIKTKYRDTSNSDYEASEAKQVHSVNPYEIEVPRPVIVPVPQPYPVRVPVAKPIAVPVVQEVAVPIEKPIPYPVYKNVPYPIEKLVPVPVVKQVPVPVLKPYPVAVPQVRPVFHHAQPSPYRDEYDGHDHDDDYFPRPESSNIVYNKRPKGTRSRLRRPSRMSHQEHNRTKRPQRRPTVSRERDQRRYVKPSTEYHRFRYHDNDYDDDRQHSDYFTYCKRIGNC